MINYLARTILDVIFCLNRDKNPNFLYLHLDLFKILVTFVDLLFQIICGFLRDFQKGLKVRCWNLHRFLPWKCDLRQI